MEGSRSSRATDLRATPPQVPFPQRNEMIPVGALCGCLAFRATIAAAAIKLI